jgi:ABC-type multidrug transport system permease subunit
MLRGLVPAVAKDLRLLARDRAGIVFLTLAPVVVMTVAGFSLATLYGAGPTGSGAYLLPVADEDGGRIARALARRLEDEPVVRLQPVAAAAEARALVRAQRAGAALVVPAGTSAAIASGRDATLLLYTDPVKYFEIAHVTAVVQELRHAIEELARRRSAHRLEKMQERAARARADLARAARELRATLDDLERRLASARADAEQRAAAARARAVRALHARIAAREASVRARLVAELRPLRDFLDDLARTQRAFDAWLADVRTRAGRLADRMPPPPSPPRVPPALATLDADAIAARLLGPDGTSVEVALPTLQLPAVPPPPTLSLPALPAAPALVVPGGLAIAAESVTGAPRRLNTFDQNVPGFGVTFLLLGMLLGVSLGLLDERDWGTLERLRAMPTPFATTLVAKLLARFAAGVVQMVVLLGFGHLAFGASLGPQPWALLLPTVGIVFAGTAFGLVVAGAARSREAVLPVGSIVIVTMAAVGGCWWPIDLEPPWMRQAALALPTTWAMAAYNDLMIRRQTVEAALVPTAVLLLHGLVYATVGVALFRRHTRAGD